jgi:hypothetical protein
MTFTPAQLKLYYSHMSEEARATHNSQIAALAARRESMSPTDVEAEIANTVRERTDAHLQTVARKAAKKAESEAASPLNLLSQPLGNWADSMEAAPRVVSRTTYAEKADPSHLEKQAAAVKAKKDEVRANIIARAMEVEKEEMLKQTFGRQVAFVLALHTKQTFVPAILTGFGVDITEHLTPAKVMAVLLKLSKNMTLQDLNKAWLDEVAFHGLFGDVVVEIGSNVYTEKNSRPA